MLSLLSQTSSLLQKCKCPKHSHQSTQAPVPQDQAVLSSFSSSFSLICTCHLVLFTCLCVCLCVPRPAGQFLNGSYCSFEEDDCGWQMISSKSVYKGVHLSLPKRLTNTCPSSGRFPKFQQRSSFYNPLTGCLITWLDIFIICNSNI